MVNDSVEVADDSLDGSVDGSVEVLSAPVEVPQTKLPLDMVVAKKIARVVNTSPQFTAVVTSILDNKAAKAATAAAQAEADALRTQHKSFDVLKKKSESSESHIRSTMYEIVIERNAVSTITQRTVTDIEVGKTVLPYTNIDNLATLVVRNDYLMEIKSDSGKKCVLLTLEDKYEYVPICGETCQTTYPYADEELKKVYKFWWDILRVPMENRPPDNTIKSNILEFLYRNNMYLSGLWSLPNCPMTDRGRKCGNIGPIQENVLMCKYNFALRTKNHNKVFRFSVCGRIDDNTIKMDIHTYIRFIEFLKPVVPGIHIHTVSNDVITDYGKELITKIGVYTLNHRKGKGKGKLVNNSELGVGYMANMIRNIMDTMKTVVYATYTDTTYTNNHLIVLTQLSFKLYSVGRSPLPTNLTPGDIGGGAHHKRTNKRNNRKKTNKRTNKRNKRTNKRNKRTNKRSNKRKNTNKRNKRKIAVK